MTLDVALILLVLAGTMVLFLWGRWRHDVVAMMALLVSVLAGLVPRTAAFVGFGHPAVVTVACVLILSRGLQSTGAIDTLAQRLLPRQAGPTWTLTGLVTLGALLSAFMNNVGAMALLMPLALQAADKHGLPPGKVLMPLSFGTILGGMTTLIGTPPNLIVAGFRAGSGGGGFAMFDFAPVGLSVAGVGILFLVLLGRWFVPTRPGSQTDRFDTGTYLTEARVKTGSKAIGVTLREADNTLTAVDAQIVGLIRNETRIGIQNRRWVLREGDILVIEAEPDSLGNAVSRLGLALPNPKESDEAPPENAQEKKSDDATPETAKAPAGQEEIVLQELVPLPQARLLGQTTDAVDLRSRYGLTLLAISRQGRRIVRRLRATLIQAGDVLLLQGPTESLAAFANEFGCVPLAQRAISLPNRGRAVVATAVMLGAIVVAATGWLATDVAFAGGALLFVLFRILSPRAAYEAVDWSVIVLLAGLIPVAEAMATTGAADWLAGGLLASVARGHSVVALILVLVITMTLSDFMNNAATAAVMCPLALSAASQLDVHPDAFLMAVAVGASCAFLTPVGHQNNTLILGPGGFRFGDYWRLGLPMEIIVVAVSVPVLLIVWPL